MQPLFHVGFFRRSDIWKPPQTDPPNIRSSQCRRNNPHTSRASTTRNGCDDTPILRQQSKWSQTRRGSHAASACSHRAPRLPESSPAGNGEAQKQKGPIDKTDTIRGRSNTQTTRSTFSKASDPGCHRNSITWHTCVLIVAFLWRKLARQNRCGSSVSFLFGCIFKPPPIWWQALCIYKML